MHQELTLDMVPIQEFFRDKVCQAFNDLHFKASPHAEFYLVNLLIHFTQTEKLFEKDEKGQIQDKALAVRLFEAMMANHHQRIVILKKLGDLSLYLSGFFADSFLRKVFTIDYYIRMGHTAYSSLSSLMTDEKSFAELYGELSDNFRTFVSVIAQVADSAHFKTDQNLLRLYERWLATGSKQAETILSSNGIILQGQSSKTLA